MNNNKKYKYIILSALAFLGFNYSNIFAEAKFRPFVSSGYLEAFYYPPHNEYDPNPSIPFAERSTARYGLDFESTLALQSAPKIFGFAHSFSAFGNTKPQISYNYRADPIMMILDYGVGYKINSFAQIRLTTSRHINLGKYKGECLPWTGISFRLEW